jgi:hypothetical protein
VPVERIEPPSSARGERFSCDCPAEDRSRALGAAQAAEASEKNERGVTKAKIDTKQDREEIQEAPEGPRIPKNIVKVRRPWPMQALRELRMPDEERKKEERKKEERKKKKDESRGTEEGKPGKPPARMRLERAQASSRGRTARRTVPGRATLRRPLGEILRQHQQLRSRACMPVLSVPRTFAPE